MKNFYALRLLAIGFLLSFLTFFNGCTDSPVSPPENQAIKGVLRDRHNEPIPNAIMEIVQTTTAKKGLLMDNIIEKDTTDEDGNFAFAKIPSDMTHIDLRILHPDLKPFQEKLNTIITSKSNKTDVQIQAEYQDSCCGRVLVKVYNAQDSTILTGVEVRLNFGDNLKRKSYTNDAGQINFYELCMGSYWVRLAKYGFNILEQSNITVTGCGEENMVVVSLYMTPFQRDSCCNGVLSIEPLDKNTNNILNGATIKLRKDGTEISRKVIEGQPAIFRELCRGEYQYVIIKEGYKAIETNITLGCNDSVSLRPQMEEIPCCDGVLTVKVVDSLNVPIREATVMIFKGGVKLGYYYTNADGIVKFTGLCESDYGLNIVRTGYKSIEFLQHIGCDDSVEVTKQLSAVLKDSCCNNVIKVSVKDSKTNEPLNGSVVKMFREGALQRSETVVEGIATFREVCKGTYTFLIKRDGYESVDFTLTVECGKTYEVAKTLTSNTPSDSCCKGMATVVVKNPEGNAMQYAIVRLWKAGTKIREATTTDNGTITFRELCEGSYAFSINREGYKEMEWTFTMGCNDTVSYEKTLVAVVKDTCCKGQINLTIIDENGNPVSLVSSRLNQSGTVIRDGKTNDAGKISWGELCTGSYWIRIAKDGYKVQEFEFNIECNQVYNFTKTLVKSSDTCCTAVMKILAIRDSAEARINDARVEVYIGDRLVASGYTNAEGWWAADGLCAPNTYNVVVKKEGYVTKEVSIRYETCLTKSATVVLPKN